MADTTDAGQQKPADAGQKTTAATPAQADSSAQKPGEVRDGRRVPDRTESEGPDGFDPNPHGNYDLMSLDDLRTEAKRQGVWISPDAERAHLVSALRAGITTTR
jgi:hypothetical protein